MLKINQSILKYFLGFVIDTISFVHPETEMILTNLHSPVTLILLVIWGEFPFHSYTCWFFKDDC